jgi:uncharacterized protein YndB with AHSA1/START domain
MTAAQSQTQVISRRIGETTLSLPPDHSIVMTRWFDAPQELVFLAHSSCEHVSRWWGRRGDTMPSCDLDFRPGGQWRFVNVGEDGVEITFFGEYRTIVEPERIDWTFAFEGMDGEPGLESMTLEEKDGGTLLRTVSEFPSDEVRDLVIATGMEHGAAETWDRLAEHLATLG